VSNLDGPDGIDEARFDRLLAPHAPRRRTAGPRTSLRRDSAKTGWAYAVTLRGVVVAEGWTAGTRGDAHRLAAARVEQWRTTGAWSDFPDTTADAGAGPSPAPPVVTASPAVVSDLSSRLAVAVDRVCTALEYGAELRGHTLPDGFAIERARNIVSGLIDLFDPEAFQ